MAGIRQQGDFQHTIEGQAAWDTPIDTAPIGLITNNLVINMEPDVHDTPHDRGLRFMDEADSFADTEASTGTAEADVTVTPTFITDILPGLLQKTSAWTDTAGVWDFYSISSVANVPLCRTSDQGYFYTITKRSPTASHSERLSNAVMRRCVLTIHPKNGNTPGSLSAKCEWIGTTYTNTANPSASITHDEVTTLYKWGGIVAVSYNGTSILDDFISAEFDFTFGAKFIGDVPTGEVAFPKFECKTTFTVSQNSTIGALKSTIRNRAIDTAVPFVIDWSAAGTMADAGDLKITAFGYPTEFNDTDRAEGEVQTVTMMSYGGTLASNEHPLRIQAYVA